MYTPFIAVHVGAGRHNKKYDPELIECCNNACFATMSDLKDGKSAIAAVENAVKILEDNPLTNSGTGSSLTKSGFVECDAGLMDGKSGMFGCIGAVPGIFKFIQSSLHEVFRCKKSNISR